MTTARTLVVTNGEALGLQCSRAGPETFEREEESQGATSLRTGLLSMALHLHWGLCLVILGRALLVLGWHHCLLGERHRKIPPHLFYFVVFTRNIAGTEKLLVKGHTSALPPTPSPSYSIPLSAYPCPQIAGMGMTLPRMTSGDAQESRYLHIFKLPEKRIPLRSGLILRTEKQSASQTLHLLPPTPRCTHRTTWFLL